MEKNVVCNSVDLEPPPPNPPAARNYRHWQAVALAGGSILVNLVVIRIQLTKEQYIFTSLI